MTGAAVAVNGALENITVSHEIEERATALVQGEEDDEDNSSEVADKEFVDQGAFHSEPVIVDVSGTHIKVYPKNGNFFYFYSHFQSFCYIILKELYILDLLLTSLVLFSIISEQYETTERAPYLRFFFIHEQSFLAF